MAPTLHLVRHAQGYHNLSINNHGMPDPLLTPLGKQQCEQLQATFPYSSSVDGVVASPLRRTVYTALYSFSDIICQRRLKVIALPEVQEISDIPCDTGSTKDVLLKEFKDQPVDLSRVEEGWDSKEGRWAADAPAIEERCRIARRWLREREEEHIVVVTHGGVLHYLTEDWSDYDNMRYTGWANTEYRSYTFDPNSGSDASIVETEESRTRRRGTEKPLSEAEQRNLKMTITADWKKSGYLATADQSGSPLQSKA